MSPQEIDDNLIDKNEFDEETEIDFSPTPTPSTSKIAVKLSDDSALSLSKMYQNWFLDYASYVILERAVPHILD